MSDRPKSEIELDEIAERKDAAIWHGIDEAIRNLPEPEPPP